METAISVILGVILAYVAIMTISRGIKKAANGGCSCGGACKGGCHCGAVGKHWDISAEKKR